VTAVLDASALIAYFRHEPGAEQVRGLLRDARVSALNWSEVHQKLTTYGLDADHLTAGLLTLGVQVEPFGQADAVVASKLYPLTRPGGVSLADRACLALAHRLGLPVYSADRQWSRFDMGADIRMIR